MVRVTVGSLKGHDEFCVKHSRTDPRQRCQLEHANSKTHQGKETKAIFILEDIADIMKQMGDET